MSGSEEQLAFKLAVKQAFITLLQQRIQTAQAAMDEAQASANSQEKSSAGDKYETARAMGQIDRDMNAVQLAQAKEELRFLESIPATLLTEAAPGAIIEYEQGVFFAVLGLGQLRVLDKTVMAISCRSPLFEQLRQKKSGDTATFRGQELKLRAVY